MDDAIPIYEILFKKRLNGQGKRKLKTSSDGLIGISLPTVIIWQKVAKLSQFLEAYLEPCQTSRKEPFSKQLKAKSCSQFSQNAPSQMFDSVLNTASCEAKISLFAQRLLTGEFSKTEGFSLGQSRFKVYASFKVTFE